MSLKPKHLLFDLDGTLLDSSPGILRCLTYTVRQFGHEAPEKDAMQVHIGAGLSRVLAALMNTEDPELTSKAVEIYRAEYIRSGMYEASLYPEVEETIKKLRSTHQKLFVATAKNERVARGTLSHFGISDYFHNIHGGQEDESRTDKTELISYILQTEHLNPDECIMIGDKKYDVIGAKANGLRCIGVSYGFGGKAELEEAGADFFADSPSDLLKLLL